MDDEKVVNDQLKGWAQTACPEAKIDQWYTKAEAEQALRKTQYDLIVLDIDFKPDRYAGVALIKAATRLSPIPVLVVSGHPEDRGVMKALDAWDFLYKPVNENDFIQTLLGILRLAESQREMSIKQANGVTLEIDPLRLPKPLWLGKRVNIPATAQRILSAIYDRQNHPDPTVTYAELFTLVSSGRNKEAIRRHISSIKAAIKEEDPSFDCLVAEPMRGYRWVSRQQPQLKRN